MTCISACIENCGLMLLQLFSHFRGSKAFCKNVSLHHRQPELFKNSSWKSGIKDEAHQSSNRSHMSIEDDTPTTITEQPSSAAPDPTISPHPIPFSPSTTSPHCSIATIQDSSSEKKEEVHEPLAHESLARRCSIQDQVSLFERKREIDSSIITKTGLCRQPSDLTHLQLVAPSASIDVQKDQVGGGSHVGEEVWSKTTKVGTNSRTGKDVPQDSSPTEKRFSEFSLKRLEIRNQVHRRYKGNREKNDNLKLKADELEKLFAEHKLRVRGDNATRLPYRNVLYDNSRGKLYDSYMKKRDARLKESMHDSLAKLLRPVYKHDSVSTTCSRTERHRLLIKSEQFEYDEATYQFLDLKPTDDGVSRTARGKKPLPIKNLSATSTPRTITATSVPKSTTKSVPSARRRRVTFEKIANRKEIVL